MGERRPTTKICMTIIQSRKVWKEKRASLSGQSHKGAESGCDWPGHVTVPSKGRAVVKDSGRNSNEGYNDYTIPTTRTCIVVFLLCLSLSSTACDLT